MVPLTRFVQVRPIVSLSTPCGLTFPVVANGLTNVKIEEVRYEVLSIVIATPAFSAMDVDRGSAGLPSLEKGSKCRWSVVNVIDL